MPQVKNGTGGIKPKGVQPNSPYTELKDIYYNMDHKYRGLALIFNHEEFLIPNLPPRGGTNKDRDKLREVLINLGFQVEVENNLTYKEIFNHLQTVANMDHSRNDCLMITVLTHGELDKLYTKDTTYDIRKLWCHFTEQNCPTLAGKPKIFIIQACRGRDYDDGITLTDRIVVDGPSSECEIPTQPDFIFAYATAPGYFSWRNTTHGSWFIQTLCDMLTEYAADTDILTILTYVCNKVSIDYKSYTPDDLKTNEKKEVPNFNSTLTRLLIFKNIKKKKKMDCCIQS